MRRLLLAAALAAASVFFLAGCPDPNHGSTKPPKPPSADQKFKTECRLKGGTPVITHQNGGTQRNCVPPPGGWQ
jgi:hypothetical protein